MQKTVNCLHLHIVHIFTSFVCALARDHEPDGAAIAPILTAYRPQNRIRTIDFCDIDFCDEI